MNLIVRYLVIFSFTIGLVAGEPDEQNQKSHLTQAFLASGVSGMTIMAMGLSFGGIFLSKGKDDERKNESERDSSPGTQFLRGFASILIVCANAQFQADYQYREVKLKARELALANADLKLKSYFQLSPEKQHEYLTNESLPIVDIIPALTMPDRFADFFASEGFKLLSEMEARELLMRSDNKRQTVFYLLPFTRDVMNRDFFTKLNSSTQLELVYAASPTEFYAKKATFMGLDIARTVATAHYGLNLRPLELLGYYYDPFYASFLEPGLPQLPRELIERIISEAELGKIEYFQVSPRCLPMVANLGVAYKKADDVILKNYGDGVQGVIKGSAEMVVYPITDALKAIAPFLGLFWQDAE